MRKLAAAAAALILGAAGPTLAQTQPASTSAGVVEVQDYLSQLAAWAQPYLQAVRQQNEALSELLEGSEVALDYFSRGDKRGGQAWSRAWVPEQTRRWDAIAAGVAGAAEEPPALPSEALRSDPRIPTMVDGFRKMPAAVGQNLRRNRPLAADMIRRIGAVASGDSAAAEALPASLTSVSLAMLEAENELAASSTVMVPVGHPMRAQLSAAINANLAMMDLLAAQQALLVGKPIDEAALAASLRQRAGAIDVAADSMERDAMQMLAEIRRAGITSGPLAAAVETALGGFDKSATIERSIAETVRAIATRFDAPGEVDWNEITPLSEQIGTLIAERAVITRERQKAATGRG